MIEETLVVRTTVEGEAKEAQITVSVPENLQEAGKEWGKETVLKLAVRMYRLDKTNAERAVLKGGEAKRERKEVMDLAKELQSNPELLAQFKGLVG